MNESVVEFALELVGAAIGVVKRLSVTPVEVKLDIPELVVLSPPVATKDDICPDEIRPKDPDAAEESVAVAAGTVTKVVDTTVVEI